MEPVKLLVVSHSCATTVNQAFFADVEAETEWSVTLLIPSRWKTAYGDLDTSLRWPSFRGKIRRENVFRPGDIPKHTYRSTLISLLREEKPDAIYVHHEPYGFATIQVYLANAVSIRRPIGFYSCQNIMKNYPVVFQQMERWVFHNSHFAFPITQGVLDVLRAKGYRNAAEILPFPIDPVLYRPWASEAAEIRARLGIGSERIVLGFIGRLVEEKGLRVLIAALKELPDLPWELLLIGEGPYEIELRQQIESLGQQAPRVRFIGYVPHTETPHWLSLLDMLVLPSETRPNWKEQFGRVLVEAMACGTPVIGSDSGEIPNVISGTGGGLIFHEGDPSALAQTIRRIICTPGLRAKLGEQGRQSVSRLYDPQALVRRFATIVQNAAVR
jgi:glycosyltransferase involved in cell wall biosynthesis